MRLLLIESMVLKACYFGDILGINPGFVCKHLRCFRSSLFKIFINFVFFFKEFLCFNISYIGCLILYKLAMINFSKIRLIKLLPRHNNKI